MATIPAFDQQTLQAICDVIADTNEGLTGPEIGRFLAQGGIPDVSPGITKRHRLFAALASHQTSVGVGNHVATFIVAAMKPVNYLNSRHQFEHRRGKLNEALAFAGLQINERGELHYSKAAQTLTEAQQRAGRLRRSLTDRSVHGDVLRFCKAELLQDNYFHAVFEATKSVADKIRARTGLASDGSQLVDAALSLGRSGIPILAFNSLQTESEQSEHKGIVMLIKGCSVHSGT